MNHNIVILLTACINPKGMSCTALQDAETRKRQYLEAIDFYLEKSKYGVVFAENTGTDISRSISRPHKYAQRFEYLTFKGNDYDKELGKGYGEAQIIKYAIRCSQLIKNAHYIIKITGRVKILNINSLLCGWLYRRSKVALVQIECYGERALSVCFASSKEWLMQTVRKYDKLLNDTKGFYFEHMLYLSLLESKQVCVLPCFPLIEGVSGTTNKRYGQGKMLVRRMDSCSSLSNLYMRRHEYGRHIIAKMLLCYYVLIGKWQKQQP